jgi:D-glycero-D-manno-heptose 1,7-bisphosphate phosphatase
VTRPGAELPFPPGRRPAAFLDRDGTIVDDPGFLDDPEAVQLLPDAASAIRRLNEAGWAVIVVTNQSGIARGYFTEDDYQAVRRRVDELLARQGARVDAHYHCPHHPSVAPCECRKPGLKHYRDAVGTFGIDPERSWCVGDRLTDLLPARALGGHALLVQTGEGRASEAEARAAGFPVVKDLAAAVTRMLAARG